MNGHNVMVRGGLGVATAGVIAVAAFNVYVGVVLVVLGLVIALVAGPGLTAR